MSLGIIEISMVENEHYIILFGLAPWGCREVAIVFVQSSALGFPDLVVVNHYVRWTSLCHWVVWINVFDHSHLTSK